MLPRIMPVRKKYLAFGDNYAVSVLCLGEYTQKRHEPSGGISRVTLFGLPTHLCEVLAVSLLWIFSCAWCLLLRAEHRGGHKQDLLVGVIFFGIRSASSTLYAWDQVRYGGTMVSWPWIHWLSTVSIVSAVFYMAARYTHAAITLARSEWIERVLKNKEDDGAMENLLLPYAAAAIRQGLEATQEQYAMRGLGWRTQQVGVQHSPQSAPYLQ
jgi:hypothetical protein